MRSAADALRERQRGAFAQALYALVLVGCALAAVHSPRGVTAVRDARAVEWPSQWDGRALRPLALGAVEQRFAARFPGALARLTDGQRHIVLRSVSEPTRMLHPAADCYRAAGYRIDAARLESDADARRWRCFEALRDGERVRVCERIVDADGTAFTDTSGWFWSALLGRSRGPWLAMTTAQVL